jgi:hypothetical protein
MVLAVRDPTRTGLPLSPWPVLGLVVSVVFCSVLVPLDGRPLCGRLEEVSKVLTATIWKIV